MCVLQPRQLFARAANVLANKLPAECVLHTPEDGAGLLCFLPALLPAAPIFCQCHHLLQPPHVGTSAGPWGLCGNHLGTCGHDKEVCRGSEAGQASWGVALALRDVAGDLQVGIL